MEHTNNNYKEVMRGVTEQFREILDNSKQAVYIFLDDENKVCNSAFASLLGYDSPAEWAGVTESFPMAFLAEKSRHMIIGMYQNAMEEKVASLFDATWIRKDGSEVNTKVILVPIAHKGELLALHFVEKV